MPATAIHVCGKYGWEICGIQFTGWLPNVYTVTSAPIFTTCSSFCSKRPSVCCDQINNAKLHVHLKTSLQWLPLDWLIWLSQMCSSQRGSTLDNGQIRFSAMHSLLMYSHRYYPYLLHRRVFFKAPPPLWKFKLSFPHFFRFFGVRECPTPRKFQFIPSGVWIFSETAQQAKDNFKLIPDWF